MPLTCIAGYTAMPCQHTGCTREGTNVKQPTPAQTTAIYDRLGPQSAYVEALQMTACITRAHQQPFNLHFKGVGTQLRVSRLLSASSLTA